MLRLAMAMLRFALASVCLTLAMLRLTRTSVWHTLIMLFGDGGEAARVIKPRREFSARVILNFTAY